MGFSRDPQICLLEVGLEHPTRQDSPLLLKSPSKAEIPAALPRDSSLKPCMPSPQNPGFGHACVCQHPQTCRALRLSPSPFEVIAPSDSVTSFLCLWAISAGHRVPAVNDCLHRDIPVSISLDLILLRYQSLLVSKVTTCGEITVTKCKVCKTK